MKFCTNCSFDNSNAASYCQNCGSKLKKARSLKQFIKSINWGSVAGLGNKGVSIAPLVGMESDKYKNINSYNRVNKSHSLKDGSWYCPYCGTKNTMTNFSCINCLRTKP